MNFFYQNRFPASFSKSKIINLKKKKIFLTKLKNVESILVIKKNKINLLSTSSIVNLKMLLDLAYQALKLVFGQT